MADSKAPDKIVYTPPWSAYVAIHDLESTAISMTGGVGSAKTEAGCCWKWDRDCRNSQSVHSWIVMPTYGKIFDTAIPRYVKFLEKRCGLKKQRDFVIIKSPYPMLKYKPHIFKSEREIHFVSGSRPDTMVGVEVSDVWIDEPGRMSSQVFTEVMERLRCPVAKVLQVLMTGSPQGLNWWADEFDF